ncbi:flagellar motor switch protein FliN [Agrobacterium vitis]|uniref:flagellar motor switch protein FliN n=1 Tax=Agrobacterium vitis TaxID=373 RepID=UPI001573AAC8|nr:flagellar motor switch protein FliN [Agrobacterium vitis]NSZ15692.1 flagellar motor switch protein FliN [Agrobacterium vitis]QZO04506.1 flagellar motor switch protein FliN [Agrobacterium vitis]UJL86649.1 flagellar motor switch protein FliN [Agrobacterium vitis]
MATKKTPVKDDDALAMPLGDADLDQAIDDLRGVLKSDSDGGLPDIGADFGGTDFAAAGASDFGDAAGGLSDFESDFGGGAATGASDFGTSDFGGGDFGGGDFGGSDLGGAGSFDAAPAHQAPGSALDSNLDLIMDIPIDVQIVLGSSRMPVSGLMNLEEGAIIALDKKIGEPVEIMVNGRRIARGEITVLENDDTRFGVKLIEVMSTKTS